MGKRTVYAVVTFSRSKGGFTIDPPLQVSSADSARRMAARKISEKIMGAVAFSRTGDLAGDEFDAPVLLGQFGSVPIDLADVAV